MAQTGQAGWMVPILQKNMVNFQERSALAIVLQVANIQAQFQLKIVSHFTSTKFLSPLVVFPATAAQTKSESNNFTK